METPDTFAIGQDVRPETKPGVTIVRVYFRPIPAQAEWVYVRTILGGHG